MLDVFKDDMEKEEQEVFKRYFEQVKLHSNYNCLNKKDSDLLRHLHMKNLKKDFGDIIPIDIFLKKYNRICIGDHGAYLEFEREDALINLKIKEGQEYRAKDNSYAKYVWLTFEGYPQTKVYLQKRKVGYADYIPGKYYVSPYDLRLYSLTE